jgi:HEXXH motif-containing protein
MIPVLRLTPDGFAELAAGQGDSSVLRTLRAGQLGKHLLLLREVVRVAAELGGETAARAQLWFEVIATADERAPDLTREVLGYPQVGAWAVHCLARLREAGAEGPADLDRLAAVAAAVAIRSGTPCRLVVPVSAGRIALPTVGTALLGSATSSTVPATSAVVVVGTSGTTITAGAPDEAPGGIEVVLPDDPGADGPGWLGLRRLEAAHAGLRLDVFLDDLDPYRDIHGLGAAGRQSAAEVAAWRANLVGAWRLLVEQDRQYAETMSLGLRAVVPLAGCQPGRGMNATSKEAFGAVAISAPSGPLALAVGLVHEYQHSKLNGLLHLIDLYADDGSEHYSPWRDDPRSLGGLLHGAYAYLAVAEFWRVHRDGELAGTAEFEFARWQEAIMRTVDALLRSGRLTPIGNRFVAGMRERVTGWRSEPVTEPNRRLAADAVHDHRVAWRVRNLRCEPAAVDRLAHDWLGGRRPSVPTSAADLSYVDGAFDRAAAAYRAELAQLDDVHAWAGLALADRGAHASVWRAPELVAAVYRRVVALGGPPPDLVELPGWLADVEVTTAAW